MYRQYPVVKRETYLPSDNIPRSYYTAYCDGFNTCGRTEQEAIDNLSQRILENIFPVGYVVKFEKMDAATGQTLATQQCWCAACALPCDKSLAVPAEYVPLYKINITPYSQVCDSCGKVIIDGVKRNRDGKPLCLFGLTAD